MMTKKIRVLTDLLDHLQQDRLDRMRQVEERTEQVSLVSDLLHAAAMVHEAEDDEGEDKGEAPEDMEGVFRSMGQDFRDFLSKVHTTSEEDDHHDED